MNTSDYYNIDNGLIRFSRDQASHFAKSVAGDFNPIHDPAARRFCVPGDLLFATVLDCCGLYESMQFDFLNMVDDTQVLQIVEDDSYLTMKDDMGKAYLSVNLSGMKNLNNEPVSLLTDAYVKFSGQTFPFLLVDLMKREQRMINPQRPLVVYKSMTIDLQILEFSNLQLEFRKSDLQIQGKKGEVNLEFELLDKGKSIGSGKKTMLLGGLQPFEDAKMTTLVENYNEIKRAFSTEVVDGA